LSENLEVHSDIIECFNLKYRLDSDVKYELIQEDISQIDDFLLRKNEKITPILSEQVLRIKEHSLLRNFGDLEYEEV